MAATTVILSAAWACGDGGGVEPNDPPVANFTAPSCTAGTPCAFTDASTDDHGVTGWSWNFGDPNAAAPDQTSTLQSPSHTYSVAGNYTVSLTVTDASGETNTKTNTVTVAPVTGGNLPPTVSFDLPACTAGTPCGFHSTSTDPDGDIAAATFGWNFGDGSPAGAGPDATHTYAAPGTYTVTLSVTDVGGATAQANQQVTVSPVASQDCITSGIFVDCVLTMTARSTVTITLVSRSCELPGDRLLITAPVSQTAFISMCFINQPGEQYVVKDGTGAPLVFQAGTQLALRFRQGTPGAGDPPVGDPGITVDGTGPWTLNVDDGGAAGAPGEPDFNDAVLRVEAIAAP